MSQHQAINPYLVAFLSLNPVAGTLKRGSWGATVTPVVAATSFDVVLSPEFGGVVAIGDVPNDLHVTASTKEGAAVSVALTPIAGGFRIVFGAALTVGATIKVEKLIGE